jgi:hypothetical protein
MLTDSNLIDDSKSINLAYLAINNNRHNAISSIIQKGITTDEQFKFSITNELRSFIGSLIKTLFALPVAFAQRTIVRQNKQLQTILQLKPLQKTRDYIEKGSFAYNTLLFNQKPWHFLQNKTHLANLVCLAILFGDEFLDGIAHEFGKENVAKILLNDKVNLQLQYKQQNNNVVLYYGFDIRKLLPNNILFAVNKKYGITYNEFYDHLLFLLQYINTHLNKQPNSKKQEIASLIVKVCNNCFKTYGADVYNVNLNYNWEHLVNYQKSKDDNIINMLLAIRASLLNKNKTKYSSQYSNWAYMVRSMQVYDDMQDIADDCDYQMNFLAFFAKTYFKNEWDWLHNHKIRLSKISTQDLQRQIALHMPCAMMMCMQYNKNLVSENLNWVQQKILNYLWCKNWIQWNHNDSNEIDTKNAIDNITAAILPIEHKNITTNMKYAHVLDSLLLYPQLRNVVLKKISYKEKYLLKSHYTTLPMYYKARLAKKILGSYA